MHKSCTPIHIYLVRVYPREIHTKFEDIPCSGFAEVKKVKLQSDMVIHCKYTCYLTPKKLIDIYP